MSAQILNSGLVIIGSAAAGAIDISQFTGSIEASPGAVTVRDVTNLAGGGYVQKVSGAKSAGFRAAGFSDFASGAINAAFPGSSAVGQQVAVAAAVPQTPTSAVAAADPCFFTRGLVTAFTPLRGNVDDVAGMSLELTGDTAQIQGQAATSLAARTTTANGTVLTMTGPTASQRIWAALFITAASGTTPTLAVKIQSATLVGFGSPTDRITFSSANAAGWQFASALGAITDGFWRATWTIGGTTPSFTFFVAVGVL